MQGDFKIIRSVTQHELTMKLIRVATSLLSLACLCTAVVGSPSSAAPAEPASALEVLATLKQIVDDRSFAKDDFYTQAELLHRFGSIPDIKLNESTGVERSASVVGYGRLADIPQDPPGLPNGIFIGVGKYLWPRDTKAQAPVCYLQATFRGFVSGMDFDNVVARLGASWHRNVKAEHDRFMASSRESFNPPFPMATAPMGNAIIDYGQGDSLLELEFTPSGVLHSVSTTRRPC